MKKIYITAALAAVLLLPGCSSEPASCVQALNDADTVIQLQDIKLDIATQAFTADQQKLQVLTKRVAAVNEELEQTKTIYKSSRKMCK